MFSGGLIVYLLRLNDFHAAHVRLQCPWNTDSPIRLLVILQQRDENSRAGYRCIVKRMAILKLSRFITVANIAAAGLEVKQV